MLSHDRFFYAAPARVLFGCGVRGELAPLIARLGWCRALVVTDRFFSHSTSVVAVD